jgi:hypothetical protein
MTSRRTGTCGGVHGVHRRGLQGPRSPAPLSTGLRGSSSDGVLELDADELDVAREALRLLLRDLERWLARLERDRARRPDAPAPTPLVDVVKARCQLTRALLRRVA